MAGGLAVVLVVLVLALPLRGNADHAAAHLSLGAPVLILLVLAVAAWPAPAPARAARWVRGLLLLGLALFGSGQVAEAVGAFGYAEDGIRAASNLTVLHDIGVAVGPAGFSLSIAAVIMSIALAAAQRRGAAGSRGLTIAVILAVAAVVAFVLGALIFGY